jgi:hypothetical protein
VNSRATIQFKNPGDDWKFATAKNPKHKLQIDPIDEKYLHVDQDMAKPVVKKYVQNDFGETGFRVEGSPGLFIHTGPESEDKLSKSESEGELTCSHGCLHVQPAKRNELMTEGYLQKGVTIEIKGYKDVLDPGSPNYGKTKGRRLAPMRFLIIALALHGCTKTPAPEPQNVGGGGSQSTKAAPVDAGAATVTPDGRPPASACGGDQDKLISKARGSAVSMFSAMDGAASYAASLAAWSAVAPGCRDGRWFYAAALLLSYRSSALEAGATKFTAVDEVLTAALAASGTDDDELLARIAYNAAMGRKPASPRDACARATKVSRAGADDATYMCAQEALASGDGQNGR